MIDKNDYTKEEDEALWELHEIRRTLNNDLKNKSVEEINNDALEKFAEWKNNECFCKMKRGQAPGSPGFRLIFPENSDKIRDVGILR